MTLILTRTDVERVLTMRDCIEVLDQAMRLFSAGGTLAPQRLVTHVPGRGDHLAMPAVIPALGVMGIKCVTAFPDNPSRAAPTIMGLLMLNDADTGRPLAVMDAAYLTAVRTGAASAVATRALAREDSGALALIGAGVQAATHLWAMTEVRPVRSVAVTDVLPGAAERFAAAQAPRYPAVSFRVADSPEEAITGADLICTVSSSRAPVTSLGWIGPGAHINAVGSHAPDAREIDGRTMEAARVVVDSREAALREPGDCIIPLGEGLFGPEHVSDEIGEVLAGSKSGRTSDTQITLYKSVGIAVQDIAAGKLAYDRAGEHGVGREIDL